jgi:hypothetical protein
MRPVSIFLSAICLLSFALLAGAEQFKLYDYKVTWDGSNNKTCPQTQMGPVNWKSPV